MRAATRTPAQLDSDDSRVTKKRSRSRSALRNLFKVELKDRATLLASLRSFQRTFRRAPDLLALISEHSRRGTVTLFLATIALIAILPTGTSLFTKLQLDVVAYAVGFQGAGDPFYFNSAHGWDMKDISQAFKAVLVLQAIAFTLNRLHQHVLTPLQEYLTTELEHRLQTTMTCRIMQKCSDMDFLYLQGPQFRDEMSLIRKSPVKLTPLVGVINSAIQITCVVWVLMQFSWLWVFMSVLLSVPTLVRTVVAELTKKSDEKEHAQLLRKSDYMRNTMMDEIKETKLFHLVDFFLPRYKQIEDTVHDRKQEKLLRQSFTSFLVDMPSNVVQAGVKLGLCWKTLHGTSSITDISYMQTLVNDAIWQFYLFCSKIGESYVTMMQIETFLTFMARESAVRSPDKPIPLRELVPMTNTESKYPVPVPLGMADDAAEVEFINVGFRYPGNEEYTLRNVNFKIARKQHVALLGVNGAGKSTLIKLLCRLVDCTEGVILFNGHPIQSYDLQQLYRQLACLFQDFQRYELSVGDNIGMGSIADYTDARADALVWYAAETSGATTVIAEKLKGSLSAQLGAQFDGGTPLSGGEWQKTALARTYMRMPRASLLILDEPTAALDADADVRTFETLRAKTKDKTVLFITHRLGSVRDCDQILVLDEGHIVEAGSHALLMRIDGHYAKIYRGQADLYRQRSVDLSNAS